MIPPSGRSRRTVVRDPANYVCLELLAARLAAKGPVLFAEAEWLFLEARCRAAPEACRRAHRAAKWLTTCPF
ncbi:MAG TPA: hypothetical protein VM597_28400 [Gemmataceae bacterium]|nr:hypothetical protein [Gemmataceae bacterium]